MELKDYREQIDRIDEEIVRLGSHFTALEEIKSLLLSADRPGRICGPISVRCILCFLT